MLLHDGTAVLAVDENLRYGPMKSGYHGGASPAEVVVPVTVLVPGAVPAEPRNLRLAPPQEPAWWPDPVTAWPEGRARQSPRRRRPAHLLSAPIHRQARHRTRASGRARRWQPCSTSSTKTPPTSVQDAAATRSPSAAEPTPPALRPQRRRRRGCCESHGLQGAEEDAGRVSVTDAQVGALLTALLAAPGHRLAPAAAASALQVAPVLLRGAMLQVQRLLNIEGYAVIRVDADGATLILDEALLRSSTVSEL